MYLVVDWRIGCEVNSPERQSAERDVERRLHRCWQSEAYRLLPNWKLSWSRHHVPRRWIWTINASAGLLSWELVSFTVAGQRWIYQTFPLPLVAAPTRTDFVFRLYHSSDNASLLRVTFSLSWLNVWFEWCSMGLSFWSHACMVPSLCGTVR